MQRILMSPTWFAKTKLPDYIFSEEMIKICQKFYVKLIFSAFCFLITGPMKLNGCPMRRINQHYLLATTTNVDITNVKVPENINDDYFKQEIKTESLEEDEDDEELVGDMKDKAKLKV